MVTLENYIFEGERTTGSNSQRKKELEQWLKNKDYPDYVETLNKMLEDPKSASLLRDGFGGDLGNMKLRFSVKHITASALRPTQSEIDISKSIKYGLTKPKNIEQDFDDEVILANMPLITFRGNYVIDGHHRWAEPAVINPSAKMVCFDYDGDISPIQMLKAVQGAIAAVIADKNDNNGKIPSSIVDDKNLFTMSKSEIVEYIKNTITDEVKELIKDNVNIQSDDVVDYLTENIISLQNNNYPEDGMPNRGEMPQTDKAGKDKSDKKSAMPDKEGSALNKLKTGKIDKDAIK